MSRHDYVNPAFCQKSEFYRSKKALSPSRESQKLPLTHQRIKTDISNNPLHNPRSNRYACAPSEDLPPKPGPKPIRYASSLSVPKDTKSKSQSRRNNDNLSKSRYELTELEENEDSVDGENTADFVHNGRVHRYAVIPTVDEFVEESNIRYESLPPLTSTARCHDTQRYGSVPSSPVKQTVLDNISPARRQLATQMLHELLTIPPRSAAVSKSASFSISPSGLRGEFASSPGRHTSTPKQLFGPRVPRRSSLSPPRAQRSLDYNRSPPRISVSTNNAISDYEMSLLHRLQKQQHMEQQRTLAVIPPRQLASPSSDVTISDVTSSKMAPPGLTAAAIVAAMLIIAGTLDSGLCMHLMYTTGRSYYLELGLVNGFACVALGLLGFRSSRCVWLPNRNYVSGFILLTVLTLFACCGLLVLLVMRPLPGSAQADVTSGAISCLSALALLLVSLGVISTSWCRATPPDNRVDTTDEGY